MADPHVVTVHIERDANFVALMDQWQRERRAIREVIEAYDHGLYKTMGRALEEYQRIRSEDVGSH